MAPRDRRPADRSRPVPFRKRRRGAGRFVAGTLAMMAALFCAVVFWPSASVLPISTPADDPAVRAGSFSCDVSSIHDGDTLRCADGTRVRLHAVAARETDETCTRGHPCPAATAVAARAMLVRLAGERTISCVPTGTSYNRVTAICWNATGVEINCGMVQSGTALIWPRYNRETPICRA